MKITIPGQPIAKKRPRFARRGKFVVTYNDQQTDEGKALAIIMQQYQSRPAIEGAVCVDFTFFVSRPKGHFGTGKNAGMLKSSAPVMPTTKPDIDNCVKFYLDILNGWAWHDDNQVVKLAAVKEYGDPKTVISISKMWE